MGKEKSTNTFGYLRMGKAQLIGGALLGMLVPQKVINQV